MMLVVMIMPVYLYTLEVDWVIILVICIIFYISQCTFISFSKEAQMSKACIFPSLTGVTKSDRVCNLLKVNKEEGCRADA